MSGKPLGFREQRNLTRHELEPLRMTLSTTGVNDIETYSEVRIYAEGGNVIIESPKAGTATLVAMNGIATPLRVEAGRNVFAFNDYGIYVVRMGDTVAKLRIGK